MFAICVEHIRRACLRQASALFEWSGKACDLISTSLSLVSEWGDKCPPSFQAHCLRRGTASLLKLFHMPLENINVHMGWAFDSKELGTYFRNVD